MKSILTLCLLLIAATANAQDINLLESPPAAQAAPSAFDLLEQPLAVGRASQPVAPAEHDIDLLYVAKPTPPPEFVETTACACGCNQPGCSCALARRAAGRQPADCPVADANRLDKVVVKMRSASWCSVCRTVEADVAKAGEDCPFVLEKVSDEQSQELLPVLTWRDSRGKLWTTCDPSTGQKTTGYPGLKELTRQVQESCRVGRVIETHQSNAANAGGSRDARPTLRITAAKFAPNTLAASVAASAERHFAQTYQGPPANLAKPGDSEKKRTEPSPSGSTTNANGSAKKSPAESSRNTPSASTPSPGGRSSE